MPQPSRPTANSHHQSTPSHGPTHNATRRMDFAPRKGGVPTRPVISAHKKLQPASPTTPKIVTKPTLATAQPLKPTSVSRPRAVRDPQILRQHPSVTVTKPRVPRTTPSRTATPRRPALITSAREAMNAHARARLETPASVSSLDSAPIERSEANTTQSSQPATRLHHAPAQTAPERTRVTPMPTLPPPPPRPVAPVRAGTDPLVQRAHPLARTNPSVSAAKQQIKVSTAPVSQPITTRDAQPTKRMTLPRLAAFSKAISSAENHSESADSAPAEDTSANNARYTLGEKSPFFLQSVSVEKRPLSSGRPTSRATTRKNVYPKKSAEPKPEKPTLPTIVVPDSHRSKAPMIALIIFTILLGALVGAAAYLFFFQ